jgi:glycosyltransferase involved in cell wall biosynthesis
MNKNFPKVLIIGETFNRFSGGGITLSNLFNSFPKKNIAVAANYLVINKSSNEICENLFRLGKENYKSKFPLNIIERKPSSGIIYTNDENDFFPKEKNIFIPLIKLFIKHFLSITSLNHFLRRYKITDAFIAWIKEFSPDIIYTQLGSEYAKMDFVKQIHEKLNIPIVVHIMDDWITTAPQGLLSFYWTKKFNNSFREVLSLSSLNLSISEGMSHEYESRYGHKFIPFHNPVDLKFWGRSMKSDYSINPQHVKIMYSGKIGLGKNHSIFEIAVAIEQINNENNYKIEYQIQSTNLTKKIIRKLERFKCVKINPVVEYSLLPKIYSSVDMLIIPMDFDSKGKKYLKYSMLTKASEFMISGTPIILYADDEMAMTKHAKNNKWAFIISYHSVNAIKEGILEFLNSENLRKEISKNAQQFCINHYDSNKIRQNFQHLLNTVAKNQNG